MRWMVLVVGVLGVTGRAMASDYEWCVDLSGTGAGVSCSGGPCSNPVDFASVDQAMAAARSAPEITTGVAPSHLICVHTRGTPLSEPQSFDNSDGSLGALTLNFYDEDTTFCSVPLGTGAPLLHFAGPGVGDAWQVSLGNLRNRPTDCGAPPTPAAPFLVASNTRLVADHLEIYQGEGPTFHFSDSSPNNHLTLSQSLVSGAQGPLMSGHAGLSLVSSEVSSMASDGQPIVSTGGEPISIEASALFANTVAGGAPLVLAEGGLWIERSLVGGNAVGSGASLIEAAALPGEFQPWQVSVPQWPFSAISASICGPACAAY